MTEEKVDDCWCKTNSREVTLISHRNKFRRTMRLDTASNVAILRTAPKFETYKAFCADVAGLQTPINERELLEDRDEVPMVTDDEASVDSESEFEHDAVTGRMQPDLPFDFHVQLPQAKPGTDSRVEFEYDEDVTYSDKWSAEAKMQCWHYRTGHLPDSRIRNMAKRGDLPAELVHCRKVQCSACLHAKATKRNWRTKAPVNRMSIPPADRPGSVVGVDQLISSTPGLIGQMKGFLTRKRFKVTTVFIDHASTFSFTHCQQSTTVDETLEAKRAFERFAKSRGVTIKHCHADNGAFADKGFIDDVYKCGQTISFCAVNAHHQNGKAEKRIRDLQEAARTMILHAKQRWPEAITANLWPFATRMANDMSNSAPTDDHETASPIERFTQLDIAPVVKHSHAFGSPACVLDSRAQQGKRIPKWEKKSRVGIYLGQSPRHSKKVALVLSLLTGHVSPQFHCQFDDMCDTLRPSANNPRMTSSWQNKTGFTTHVGAVKDDSGYDLAQAHADIPAELLIDETPPRLSVEFQGTDDLPAPHQQTDSDEEEGMSVAHEPEELPAPPEPVTRAGRVTKPTQKMIESRLLRQQGLVSFAAPWDVFQEQTEDFMDELEDPIAFAASSNPDVMYLNEAMSAPDRTQFERAMADEVKSHTDNKHWEVVERSAVPKGTKVLPAAWAMRRKRRIATKEVHKWKARLNVHGGKQELGVNYWTTYAPVVGWSTIRLFLITMLLNGWESRQVDFVLAFPQADVECEMFMDIPQGFEFEGSKAGHCLRLRKNLCGQKQAGRVWNQCLHDGLIARGFVQSKVDMCVYYRGDVALLIYTDDGIFIGPDQKQIQDCYDILVKPITDKAGNQLRAFKMTDEGSLSDYLGVEVQPLPNGTIKLSQPHMIDDILKDLGMEAGTKSKPTPASTTVKLTRDIDGKAYDEKWNYRSVIGKLNFLEKSTRLDLSYSVHQCARFSSDPKESHAKAVKRIGRYLMETRDKGIILDPKDHSFDCWVDASFVGDWNRVTADVDPSVAKSRSGYILAYGGCPLVWSSKVQREIALSTTEAEYNAMSESLRHVIHMMQIVDELKERKWKMTTTPPRVHCKVYEDNEGCQSMATLPKMRPRTKHLGIRLHHFREHVKRGKITIHKVPTRYQLADLATKAQPEALFKEQRESIMQWSSETKTRDELDRILTVDSLPDRHLRACEIIEHAQALNQQASQFKSLSKNKDQ